MSEKGRLVLVDGSGYIFRAFHALPPMTRRDGTPVNAVYGFTAMLMKLIDDLQPDHVAVVFDVARKTFRSDIYSKYKANRSEPPEDLVPQFALVRAATKALSLPLLEAPGFEADDLIATYARLGEDAGLATLIVSSDKDLMQLVRGDVTMLDPMKQRRIGADEVFERFGVAPEKVIDVQALAGDSTDNVPGVPGIGIKTAAELIQTFGDLDNLLANAATIKQPKRRENLINFAEQARISRQLVMLRDDAPMPLELSALSTPKRDMDLLTAFLKEQEFSRLLVRIGADAGNANGNGAKLGGAVRSMASSPSPSDKIVPAPSADDEAAPDAVIGATQPVDVDYQLITDVDGLAAFLAAATAQGFLAVDTETTGLNAAAADLVGVSMALAPGKACYVPLRHGAVATEIGDAQGGLDFSTEAPVAYKQIGFETAMAMLRPIFEDPAILKIGHNLKYDSHILLWPRNGGIKLSPVDDTMCLSYVLDGGRVGGHSMDHLAKHWLDYDTIKFSDVCGKGAKQVPFGTLAPEGPWIMPLKMLISRFGFGSYSSRALGLNRLRQFMKGWNVRLFRSLLKWKQAASPLTGLFWHACRMILPNAWLCFKAKFTSLPVKSSILPHQSSLVKSCLKKWGSKAVKKPKQVPFPPRQMCWKILPLRVSKLPPRFLNGGIWQN